MPWNMNQWADSSAHQCRWRPWDQAKSSMPVGVMEKDTVLFAVPKKGRTCGGMAGWLVVEMDVWSLVKAVQTCRSSQYLKRLNRKSDFDLEKTTRFSVIHQHYIQIRIFHLQSRYHKEEVWLRNFQLTNFRLRLRLRITSHCGPHLTHRFTVGITSHLKIVQRFWKTKMWREGREKHVMTNKYGLDWDRWWATGLHLTEILFLLIFPSPRDWDYMYAIFMWIHN